MKSINFFTLVISFILLSSSLASCSDHKSNEDHERSNRTEYSSQEGFEAGTNCPEVPFSEACKARAEHSHDYCVDRENHRHDNHCVGHENHNHRDSNCESYNHCANRENHNHKNHDNRNHRGNHGSCRNTSTK